MVNQLHHLEALVVCDAMGMDVDFGKLESHPSLQMIKLMTNLSTRKAFTSVLQLWQLQELWIMNMLGRVDEPDEVSFHSCFYSTAS